LCSEKIWHFSHHFSPSITHQLLDGACGSDKQFGDFGQGETGWRRTGRLLLLLLLSAPDCSENNPSPPPPPDPLNRPFMLIFYSKNLTSKKTPPPKLSTIKGKGTKMSS
jgi:hypothetical protein